MSYQRQSNQLNIRTAPTNVGGYQPRSAIAEAFQGAQSLLQSGVDLQNTRIQNESRELSLHTQILQAEAQEAERVQAERRAAAARAERARNRDIQQNYLTEARALELSYDQQMRVAGEDPELITAATNGFVNGISTLREGLPEEVYDSTFNHGLAAVSGAQSNLNENLYNIQVGQLNQRVADFSLVNSGMGVSLDMMAENFSALQENGVELGISPNDIASSIVTQQTNYAVGTVNFDNMSVEDREQWVADQRAWNDAMLAQDPRMLGKPYWNDRLDTINEIELGINQERETQLAGSIQSGNQEVFDETLSRLVETGYYEPYEAEAAQREFTQVELTRALDPDALAIAAFEETNGIANAEDLFPNNAQAVTAFRNIQRDSMRTAITQPSVDGDNLLREHAALNTPQFAPEINREAATQVGQAVALLRQMPSDPTSPEYQEAFQRLNEHRQQIARVQALGGHHLSEDNRRDIATFSTYMNNSDAINAIEYFDNFNSAGGDVAPVRADSTMGQFISENLPFDVQTQARLEAANLMTLGGLNEDQVQEIVLATHEFVDLGGDAQVSPQAMQILASNGLATESVQEFLEPVLFDRDSGLFPDGIYDNLDRIREGDNLRMIQSPDGNLRVTSTTGAQEFPLNREQWQELTRTVTSAHDVANRPLMDRVRDNTSVNITQEVGETLQSVNDNLQTFNPNLTADQLGSIREGLVANRDELAEAGNTLQAELRDGVAQDTASENYLVNITPNVIELAEAQLGRQLTAAEESDLRNLITNDGLAYIQSNGGLLGRPTDGLLPHIMAVATRRVGADVVGSREEGVASAIAQREQAVTEAQAALDNASNTRDINAAQARLNAAQAELDAAQAGERYIVAPTVTDASGNVVRPFVDGRGEETTTPTEGREDTATQRISIQNTRVSNAEAEVQRLQGLVDAGGDRRAMIQFQRRLESAVERLRTEREALDALLGNSN